VALAVVVLAAHQPARGQEGEPVVIQVRAKKYEFDPAEIRVKKGARVQLKVTATDRSHGFELALFPEGSDKKGSAGLRFADNKNSFKLEKDQERVVEFTAEQPGTYEIKCSVFCGMGHRGMKAKLVVE
jgi:cytochrome c oxidase subunit 2